MNLNEALTRIADLDTATRTTRSLADRPETQLALEHRPRQATEKRWLAYMGDGPGAPGIGCEGPTPEAAVALLVDALEARARGDRAQAEARIARLNAALGAAPPASATGEARSWLVRVERRDLDGTWWLKGLSTDGAAWPMTRVRAEAARFSHEDAKAACHTAWHDDERIARAELSPDEVVTGPR